MQLGWLDSRICASWMPIFLASSLFRTWTQFKGYLLIMHVGPRAVVSGSRMICYRYGQVHNKTLYINLKNSVYAVSSELLILSQANLPWQYIIISWSVLWKKLGCYVQGQGWKDQLTLTFVVYICLNFWQKHVHSNASSWNGVSFEETDLLASRSEPYRGHKNSVGLFLPDLLNCWAFCNQFDGAS